MVWESLSEDKIKSIIHTFSACHSIKETAKQEHCNPRTVKKYLILMNVGIPRKRKIPNSYIDRLNEEKLSGNVKETDVEGLYAHRDGTFFYDHKGNILFMSKRAVRCYCGIFGLERKDITEPIKETLEHLVTFLLSALSHGIRARSNGTALYYSDVKSYKDSDLVFVLEKDRINAIYPLMFFRFEPY